MAMAHFLRSSIQSIVQQSNQPFLRSLYEDGPTIEYISDLLADSQASEEEKEETIAGIFELHLDPQATAQEQNSDLSCAVKNLIHSSRSVQLSHQSSSSPSLQNPPPLSTHQKITSAHSEDHHLFKESILANHDLVPHQEPLPDSSTSNHPRDPSDKNQLPAFSPLPTKDLLDQELSLLNLSKKNRKKILSKSSDDPLLRPNLNAALVDHQNQINRLDLANKAKMKAQHDKNLLLIQKQNLANKKLAAREKTAKLERRA